MEAKKYESPSLAVDILVYRFVDVDDVSGYQYGDDVEIVVIERLNEPRGTALPGGFVDVGESCEDAAIREAKEETSLDVSPHLSLVGVFSDPKRDPRQHVVSVVYASLLREGSPELQAQSDAKSARWVPLREALTLDWVFDHAQIVAEALRRESFWY